MMEITFIICATVVAIVLIVFLFNRDSSFIREVEVPRKIGHKISDTRLLELMSESKDIQSLNDRFMVYNYNRPIYATKEALRNRIYHIKNPNTKKECKILMEGFYDKK